MKVWIARLASSRLLWPIVLLGALFLVNAIAFPGFFAISVRDGNLYGSLIDILRNGAPTLIVAVGMTLVVATRGIDLSVGAICAIAGTAACSIILVSPDPTNPGVAVFAILTGIGVGVACGLWNGMLVSVLGIQPIVATLVLMTAGRGVAMLITEGQILTVTNPAFKWLNAGFLFGIPVPVYIGAGILLLAGLLTRRTALGMLIESVGINPEASRQAGIRARGILMAVYVFCGVCAAISGLLLTANTMAGDAYNIGLFIELDAILAVVIGGTSLAGGRYSLTGTLIGALVIQTLITTVYTAGIPPVVTMIFKAAVVAVVCLLQSPTTTSAIAGLRTKLTAPTKAVSA